MDINLADFPKSREKVREVVKAQLVGIQAEMVKQIPKEMEFELPEIITQQVDLTIEYLLKNNFRFLYDVFDANGIEIEIYRGWKFFIESEGDKKYNSRMEAEEAAFKQAFKLLEAKLIR